MEDEEIIARLKNSETKNFGFNLLIKKYQKKIYWHIRKMVIDHDDADDLTQDVFLKVWNNVDKFREESQLFTWLYRIATNETLTFLRKKSKRFFLPLADASRELSLQIDQSPYINGDEIQLKLHKFLLTLPNRQRMIFNMRYFDELKYEEIAEITGTSVGSLKASYHHAVKKIENYFNSD